MTHFRLGHPIAIWKDGHVVWRYPDGREVGGGRRAGEAGPKKFRPRKSRE